MYICVRGCRFCLCFYCFLYTIWILLKGYFLRRHDINALLLEVAFNTITTYFYVFGIRSNENLVNYLHVLDIRYINSPQTYLFLVKSVFIFSWNNNIAHTCKYLNILVLLIHVIKIFPLVYFRFSFDCLYTMFVYLNDK